MARRANVSGSMVRTTKAIVNDEVKAEAEEKNGAEAEERKEGSSNREDMMILFHQSYFFTASRSRLDEVEGEIMPAVKMDYMTMDGQTNSVGEVRSQVLTEYWKDRKQGARITITEMRLDGSPRREDGRTRLIVFYSTGQFTLFQLYLPTSTPSSTLSCTEIYTSTMIADSIVLSRFYHPLIVTCSQSSILRFWRIDESDNESVRLVETASSWRRAEKFSPAVLNLKPIIPPISSEEEQHLSSRELRQLRDRQVDRFKITLAYATPIFPSYTTVAIQEFNVDFSTSSSSTPSTKITTRHATAARSYHLRQSQSSILPNRLREGFSFGGTRIGGPTMEETQERERNGIAGLAFEDPFIITSYDNIMEVFEVVSSPSVMSLGAEVLKIVYRQSLVGHGSAVRSISLVDGRCVSVADVGLFKIWNMREKHCEGKDVIVETENIAKRTRSAYEELKEKRDDRHQRKRIKRVFFDEEKIVSIVEGVEGEHIRVLRFD